jgi:hypothetical protein
MGRMSTHVLAVRFHALLVSLGALLGACGRAPVPLDSAPPDPAPVAERTMPDDDIHSGLQSENPHQMPGAGTETYAGVVRLRGELAGRDEAFLFISVMPEGSNRPLGSTKVALSDPALGTRAEGERAIPFVLEHVATIPGAVELQVWFDLDGYVDSKEEGSLIRRFPVEHGASGVDVALDPGE